MDASKRREGRSRSRLSKVLADPSVRLLTMAGLLFALAIVLVAATPQRSLVWAAPLVVAVLVLVSGVLFTFPRPLLERSMGNFKVEEVNSVRTTLIQAVGGVAAALLGILAYRQLVATGTQVDIARRSQTDQVLTNAISNLGHEQPIVRTGGAYVLRSLAHEHPQYRDPSYTLLTNLIRDRTHFRRPEAPGPEDKTTLPDMDLATFGQQRDDPMVGQKSLRRRVPDVYAALEVLRSRDVLPDGTVFALGLNDADLRGATISGADFVDADMRGARLDWADARPEGAHFQCASLQGAVLLGADLADSDFRGAHLDSDMVIGPKSLPEAARRRVLSGARFDDSTAFVENGIQLSPELTAKRLTDLGMTHVPGRFECPASQ